MCPRRLCPFFVLVSYPQLPAYAVVAFCCVSLANIGYGLVTFPDAPTAATELMDDLVAARAALAERGFVVDTGEAEGSGNGRAEVVG